jgi:hypothetical protein
MRALGLLVLTLSTVEAWADDAHPPVGEIIRRATDVRERKPAKLTCKLITEADLTDDGKPAARQRGEIDWTVRGDKVEERVLREWEDGRELTEAERTKRHKSEKPAETDAKDAKSPFARGSVGDHTFEWLRGEVLWGHRTHVIKVTARKRDGMNGTAWIDVDTFVELKGEYLIARPPTPIRWLKVQLQHVMLASGAVAPSLVQIDGAGRLLWKKFGFQMKATWQDCR